LSNALAMLLGNMEVKRYGYITLLEQWGC
jgi:hypothetical protein